MLMTENLGHLLERERLPVAQRNMERSMLSIARKDEMRNEWVM